MLMKCGDFQLTFFMHHVATIVHLQVHLLNFLHCMLRQQLRRGLLIPSSAFEDFESPLWSPPTYFNTSRQYCAPFLQCEVVIHLRADALVLRTNSEAPI